MVGRRIFLSYRLKDKKLSRQIKKALEALGMIVYRAEDNPDYALSPADKIKKEILRADLVIVIINTKNVSLSVYGEMIYAMDKTPIICMVNKKIKLSSLGVLFPMEEVECFSVRRFSYSVKRVIDQIPKIMKESRKINMNKPILQFPAIPHNILKSTNEYSGMHSNMDPNPNPHEDVPIRPDMIDPIQYRKYKMLTDDIDCSLEFGNTWRVDQIRLPRQGEYFWIVTITDIKTHFIICHKVTKAKPDVNTMSILFSTAQIVAGTPIAIKAEWDPTCKNAAKRSFDEFKSHKIQKPLLESLPYTDVLFSIASRLLKYDSEQLKYAAYYMVINYNYLQSFPGLNETPAMIAKFGLTFSRFEDILKCFDSYEKAFLYKLESKIQFVEIRISDRKRQICVKIKKSTNETTRKAIYSILRECDFQQKDDKMIRRAPYINTRISIRNSLEESLPTRTFEVCDKCHTISGSLQDVYAQNGFRMDRKMKTQPRCKSCRQTRSMISRIRINLQSNFNKISDSQKLMDVFLRSDSLISTRHVRINPSKNYNWLLGYGRQTRINESRYIYECPHMRQKFIGSDESKCDVC